KKLARE
nr:Chain F, Contaminant peptide KKLARE [Escherichia coli BL21(DE3)]